MEVTLLGIVIEVRSEQPEKEKSPMEVTLLGIVIEVRPEQPEKEESPMEVTLLGIIVDLHPAISSLVDVLIIALQLLRESYTIFPFSTTIEVRPEQLEKAELSMDVTLVGMVTEVRPEQDWKAEPPMDVTLVGMVTEVRPEQP